MNKLLLCPIQVSWAGTHCPASSNSTHAPTTRLAIDATPATVRASSTGGAAGSGAAGPGASPRLLPGNASATTPTSGASDAACAARAAATATRCSSMTCSCRALS